MIYADSSFLTSLILPDDNSELAAGRMQEVSSPLVYTSLHRLEVGNAIRLSVGYGSLDEEMAQGAVLAMSLALENGCWTQVPVEWERVYSRARGLSAAHTSTLKNRSLDIIHIAIAMELGLRKFWTFDQRQHRLAQIAGLETHP